jgi:hypothetical protein
LLAGYDSAIVGMDYWALAVERHQGRLRECPHSRSNIQAEAAMLAYQMYFLTADNQIANQLEQSCEDDVRALSKARYLAVIEDSVVDVWQESRRVAMVEPESEPLVFSDVRAL